MSELEDELLEVELEEVSELEVWVEELEDVSVAGAGVGDVLEVAAWVAEGCC